MRPLLALLCAALIGAPAVSAQPAPGASGPAPVEADAFTGTWESPGLSLMLRRVGDRYTGTATAGGRRYPLQGEVHDGVMTGIYSDDRVLQIFQASVAGDRLQMSAGGAQLALFRRAGTWVDATTGWPPPTAPFENPFVRICQNSNGSPVTGSDGTELSPCR